MVTLRVVVHFSIDQYASRRSAHLEVLGRIVDNIRAVAGGSSILVQAPTPMPAQLEVLVGGRHGNKAQRMA